jgi:hypothetical protein
MTLEFAWLVAILAVVAFSFGGHSSSDVAIQQISATQSSMLVEQQRTNSLLMELIKAQERK